MSGPDENDSADGLPWTGWPATAALFALSSGLHALAFLNLPLIPKNDSTWYLGLSHGLAADRISDLYAIGEPMAFDITYTIGYPLFLDLVRLVAGWEHLALGVLVAQHLAGIATVLILHRLGVALGRPGAGVLAALAYALYFPALYYGHLMISETLFTFLALAGALGMLRCLTAPKAGALLAVGGVLGLATLVRPVALLEVGAFGALLLLLPGPTRFASRVRQTALLGIAPALLLAASLVHNHATYGRASLSDASGRHLIDRLWAFDGTVATDAPHTARVIEACRRSGFAFRIPGLWWDSFKALRAGAGLDAAAADRLLRGAALESLAADPARYVARTPLAVWHLLSDEDTWPPPLEQTLMPEAFTRYLDVWTRAPEDFRVVARTAHSVEARRDFRRRIPVASPEGTPQQRWWLVFWRDHSPGFGAPAAVAFLLGALVLIPFGGRRDWIPVLLVAAVLLPPALLEYPYPRYRQPATPAMLLVIACAAWEIAHRLRATRRRT